MHQGEFAVDGKLVRRLLHQQFPELAGLSINRYPSSGTVHAMFLLGDELVVRLPRHADFSAALTREIEYLPKLAPRLPLQIPELVAVGQPSESYPSVWSVLRWITGDPISDSETTPEVAGKLAEFVVTMRSIDLDGPPSSNIRGKPLSANDLFMRESVLRVADLFDPKRLFSLWEEALQAEPWDERQTWIHGDLLPGNLVVRDDDLVAVVDFGETSVGNPTYDLVAGWWVFDGSSRNVFRWGTGAEPDTWSRAKGWALSGAVGALSYYRQTNPTFAQVAYETILRVIED